MNAISSIDTYVSGNICIVEVRTDDGQVGYGQTAPSEPEITARVLHRLVAKHFLGANPWDIAGLVERAVRAEYKYLGGFLLRAVSGIDTALWDLMGRTTDQPVYRLLGGKFRENVRVYASSMSRETAVEDEVRRIGETVEEHGFVGAKIKIACATAATPSSGTDGRPRSCRPCAPRSATTSCSARTPTAPTPPAAP